MTRTSLIMARKKKNVMYMVTGERNVGVQYNARNFAALNWLRILYCAGTTLPDPSFFSSAFLFYAIATLPLRTSLRQSFVRCTVDGNARAGRQTRRRPTPN
ncbi:hypothetical protein EVAR_81761_1 [Eumeta japonica]|uniref:Uncharacterized protein n=1 Tax=Eumeta variegata TaxID=151549 RepID=A0A4C1UHT3_EUMVA|nr:hypothetical protein EVAR_81761_1 [Eumeta japonica]